MSDPRISLIIPTYRRPERIVECIRSLCAQEYDHSRFEVVVVEDGPDPAVDLRALLEPVKGDLDLILVQQENAGPGMARNKGAAMARGEILAFTDDDCRPEPSWLLELDKVISEPGVEVVGGLTVNGLERGHCSQASQQLASYIYEVYLRHDFPFFASNNLMVTAATYERLGGFDRRFSMAGGEDREFCDHCNQLGLRMVWVPNAVIRHYHAMTFRGFVRQHMNYGRGAWHYYKVKAGRQGRSFRVEPFRFYWDLIRYPYLAGQEKGRLITSMLMMVTQVVNAYGYFHEGFNEWRRGRRNRRSSASTAGA